jgi:hypothetical protein
MRTFLRVVNRASVRQVVLRNSVGGTREGEGGIAEPSDANVHTVQSVGMPEIGEVARIQVLIPHTSLIYKRAKNEKSPFHFLENQINHPS